MAMLGGECSSCCGGWYCYAGASDGGYGSCCFGRPVSVVVSLSGYVECSLSGARGTLPAVSLTARPDPSMGVPPEDAWTHQVVTTATMSTDGHFAGFRLTESNSEMQFTFVGGSILTYSTTLTCGATSRSDFAVGMSRQATESKPCSDVVDALRRWDWIIGKSYSAYTPAVSNDVYSKFIQIDITGVVYS